MIWRILKKLGFRRPSRWAVVLRYEGRPAIERGWTGELAAKFLRKG